MRAEHKLILLLEICLVIFLKIHCGRAARGHKLYIQFQRADCLVYNKNFVESFNCSLRKNDITGELSLNADLVLAKEVHDVKVRTKFMYEINGNSVKFFDAEVDICKSLKHRFDFYILRMINDELRRRSNIPWKCPLKSNKLYYVRNFTINAKYFPQFFPEAKWSNYINFSSENSLTAMTFSAFGTVKRNKL